jgi:hypothetical protein
MQISDLLAISNEKELPDRRYFRSHAGFHPYYFKDIIDGPKKDYNAINPAEASIGSHYLPLVSASAGEVMAVSQLVKMQKRSPQPSKSAAAKSKKYK